MEKVKEAAMPHQGKNVRFFRTAKNIKQDDFAKQLGITQSNVTKLERRSVIEDELLLKSANILGVSIDVLKELDVENAINELGRNITIENFKVGNVGSCSSVGVTYESFNGTNNPFEKIAELYERLIIAENKVTLYENKDRKN